MSEIDKKCLKCQETKPCWQLGKKAHEKDDEYTIKEFYCDECFKELDKTKCWKDYHCSFFIDFGGSGLERTNYCSDLYNKTERLDKENKDYCRCKVRCDRHRNNFNVNWDCKACQRLVRERERERERDDLSKEGLKNRQQREQNQPSQATNPMRRL